MDKSFQSKEGSAIKTKPEDSLNKISDPQPNGVEHKNGVNPKVEIN